MQSLCNLRGAFIMQSDEHGKSIVVSIASNPIARQQIQALHAVLLEKKQLTKGRKRRWTNRGPFSDEL